MNVLPLTIHSAVVLSQFPMETLCLYIVYRETVDQVSFPGESDAMEIRKVQITGGSSFVITLPKDWAQAQKIRKNDRVTKSAEKKEATMPIESVTAKP